jgi:hypothetical protein
VTVLFAGPASMFADGGLQKGDQGRPAAWLSIQKAR